MVVKFNHLLPAMPELGMGLPNAYASLPATRRCRRFSLTSTTTEPDRGDSLRPVSSLEARNRDLVTALTIFFKNGIQMGPNWNSEPVSSMRGRVNRGWVVCASVETRLAIAMRVGKVQTVRHPPREAQPHEQKPGLAVGSTRRTPRQASLGSAPHDASASPWHRDWRRSQESRCCTCRRIRPI